MLKESTNEIRNANHQFNTIDDFGWGSHIDKSRGGLVIYMTDGKTVIANQNETCDGFIVDRSSYGTDLTEDQNVDINFLINWIAE